MLTFTHLSAADFSTLIHNAKILEQDGFGPKVYHLSDGNMLKLFRRKRLFSSALLRPHSQRFCYNAECLEARGIRTLKPLRIYRLENPAWTAVLSSPLPGETLSKLLREGALAWSATIPELATFIYNLHQNGIYFRSLHLGNIVRTPDAQLGLIDIADMKIHRRPLSKHLVQRNREHFEKYLRKEGMLFDSSQLWAFDRKKPHAI